ncbi:MAG: 3-hydroxyacyl-ACP dehydratase FabZ [Pseudomonadota bacterium]
MTENDDALPDLDVAGIQALIPHRFPFLMIDKLTNISRTEGAVGIKNVTINEPYFQGHFPQMPVMPGVLIIEAMAQTAASYTVYADNLDSDGKVVLFMGVEKAKFRKPVVPGDQLELHVRVSQRRPPVWKYEGKAKVDGKVVAEAIFAAMLAEAK